MRPQAPSTAQTIGFTLIELLVVIAIVAILSSLLLTEIKQVRTAAWNATCGSNQRSLVTAMIAYTMDYDGLLPYRHGSSEWWERMTDQLEDQYRGGYTQFRRDICHCPFVDREISNPWKFWDRFSAHYGMNSSLRAIWDTSAGSWTPTTNPQTPLPIAALSSNLVLVTDNHPWLFAGQVYFEGTASHTIGGSPWPVSIGATTGSTVEPIRWHGRSVTIACIDGHVEHISGSWSQPVMQPRFKTPASKL